MQDKEIICFTKQIGMSFRSGLYSVNQVLTVIIKDKVCIVDNIHITFSIQVYHFPEL